ncbi:rhomboid family intramembrane serine protease [Arcticibacter eurypsychrophilus]|uniref:rhomboid family intramembrane serine protease n=1 Tax=Arcticibacter eurypsychrophilus TaxID=1434752 RepID=UPI00084D6858|nr:rhomboid family intramembrane serine protease [Arcticibacter eurypsychrophilus]
MNSYNTSPFSNISPVVKNLLIINGIFYLATMLFMKDGQSQLTDILGVFYFDSRHFRIWQPITYMFMHSDQSFFHILFNMFALFSFGTSLEYVLGSKRFLNFYLITGLGALALQMAVQAFEVYGIAGSITLNVDTFTSANPADINTLRQIYMGPMVGASGAIFGVLVAFGLLFPNVELYLLFIPVPIKAKYFIPFYVVIELFMGVGQFAGDSVAHFAHLGGALFGFILIKYWRIHRPGGLI